MRQIANGTHIKTDKNPLAHGVLGSYVKNAEGNRHLKETFDLLPDEVYFFRPDSFELTYLNREARRQVDWSEADIAGRYVWDLNDHFAVEHQNFAAENLKIVVDRLLKSEDNKVSYHFTGRDGQVFESTLQIVHLNQQEKVVVVIFRDVSGREAAKKVARQYSTTLNLIQNPVFEFAPTSLRFTYANRAAEIYSGWTVAELLKMTPLDLKPEFTEPEFRALIAPLVAGALETQVFQTLQKNKSGALVPVEVSLKYMAVIGEDERIVAVGQDISERVAANKEIQNFKSSFDLGKNEVYMFWTDNLEYMYMNQAAMKNAGYLKSGFKGKSPRDHLSGKQIQRFLKRTEPLMSGGTSILVYEVYYKSKGRPLEVTLQLIKPEGDRARFFAIHRDISERKVAEAEIAQFKTTLDLMRVEIYMYRPDTLHFTYLNRAAANRVGWTKEEYLTKTPADLVEKFDEGRFRARIEPLLSGAKKSIIFESTGTNGEIIEITEQLIKPKDENQRMLTLVRDITEQKKAQKTIESYKQALDSTQDLVFIFRPSDLKFTYLNRAAMDHFGWDEQTFLEKTIKDASGASFDAEEWQTKTKPLVFGTKQALLYETTDCYGNPFEANLQLIDFGEFEPRFVAINRDLTDVTSRQVVRLFFEQLWFEFVPVFHGLQGRLAAQG